MFLLWGASGSVPSGQTQLTQTVKPIRKNLGHPEPITDGMVSDTSSSGTTVFVRWRCHYNGRKHTMPKTFLSSSSFVSSNAVSRFFPVPDHPAAGAHPPGCFLPQFSQSHVPGRLPRIQGRSSGSGHSMASAHLAYCKQPLYLRLPVCIRGNPAVIMLHAYSHFQLLMTEIHLMILIIADCRLVHLPKPLNGST